MIKNAVWVQTMQKLHYKKWEHTSITAVSDPRLRAEMSLVGYVRHTKKVLRLHPKLLFLVSRARTAITIRNNILQLGPAIEKRQLGVEAQCLIL